MSKPAVIVVTWQPAHGEMLTVTVEVPTSYPDVIAEAAMHARRLMSETLTDVLEQYRERDVTLTGEADA